MREEHPNRPDLGPRTSFGSLGSLSSISVALGEPSDGSDAAMHYTSGAESGNWLQKAVKRNLTLKGLTNKLLKKTVRRNTWIYVSVSEHILEPTMLIADLLTPEGQKL